MNKPATIRHLEHAPTRLYLDWSDGVRSEFHANWLADNDPLHRDAFSGQRLIDITDLPSAPKIQSARVEGDQVRIDWHEVLPPTRLDVAWLVDFRAAPEESSRGLVFLWPDGAPLDARRDFAWLTPTLWRSDRRRASAWMARLVREGLAFLGQVPAEPGALIDALAPVGQIVATNYGTLFDVRTVAQPENLAYSDQGLGLHTDNPYRDPVPGFQALHCLTSSATGGDSLFADGFALAEELRTADPEAFRLLTTTPVPFAYRSADAHLYAERPLIQLGFRGEVTAVHYNNRSIAPLQLAPSALEPFYRAYRRFAERLREQRFQVKVHLDPGDLVVFDNHRVLHGRTAFTPGAQARHLQGCYLSRDSVLSRAAVLRREPDGVPVG